MITASLDTQSFSLPATETYHSEAYASPTISLRASYDDLKKYYLKLKKNLNFLVSFAIFFLLGFAWFTWNACRGIWYAAGTGSGEGRINMQFEQKICMAGNWAKIPFTVGLGILLLGCVINVARLVNKRKQINQEYELFQSGKHPLSLTLGLFQSIFSLFSWRINCFWTGFTISGLAVVATVYTYLVRGFREVGGGGKSGWEIQWSELKSGLFSWHGPEREEEKAFRVILAVFVFGLVIIFVSNFLSRQLIKRSLNVFNTDESNIHPELKEKVFRLNKRGKITSTIILCVLGLGIFIIFKRVIIAIFNRSFNASRW